MIPTPYLKPLNTEGGTLYVFPSVSKDLTRTFVSNDYEFKFSHFACLNIPNIITNTNIGDNKGLYISRLMGDGNVFNSATKVCDAITENIQNYVMNFETVILNGKGDDDKYDSDILTTVSEKVFFNWLQKVGGIEFTENGSEEVYDSLADRTVQYIGHLDVMNTVEINGDTFEELYIHIPSTVGASTNVYFRNGELTDNKNYLDKNYVTSSEKLEGRENDDIYTPYSSDSHTLRNKSFTDVDNGMNVYSGDVGHTIDFRDSSYDGGEGINNMNGKSLENFEFNVVLIYYDLLQKTSTPGVKKTSTNLYGVLFLDNVINGGIEDDGNSDGGSTGVYYFQRYPKERETIYGSGNSFALKLNLKIDTIGDTNWEYVKIEDPNDVVAMSLYMKSLQQLQNCIDFFYTQKESIVKLSERISTLENVVMDIDTIASLKEDINRLYDICDGNGIVDTRTLLGLIDENTKRLDNIMNGGKDLKLQYDTDVIQAGSGIGLKKSLNKVVISSEQKYSINTVINKNGNDDDVEVTPTSCVKTSSSSKKCSITLKPGENFAVIYIDDDGESQTNFNIDIDDSEINWSTGQSMKICLVCDNGKLEFTDSSVTGFVIKPTNNVTLTIPGYKVEGNDLIEIVCISFDDNKPENNKFIYIIK